MFKTNDLLRALNFELGLPINTYNITIRYCQQAVNENRWVIDPSVSTLVQNFSSIVRVRVRLVAFDLLLWIAGLRNRLLSRLLN